MGINITAAHLMLSQKTHLPSEISIDKDISYLNRIHSRFLREMDPYINHHQKLLQDGLLVLWKVLSPVNTANIRSFYG